MTKKTGTENKEVHAKFEAKTVEIHTESKEKTIIRPKIVKKIVPAAEGSIDAGQRAIVKDKIGIWVDTSGLAGKKIHYGQAYKAFFNQAKSRGRKGVDRCADYPKEDFKKGINFLNRKISELRKTKKYQANDPEQARKELYKAIHAKMRQRKISHGKYVEYIEYKYGVNSMSKMEFEDLEELHRYTFNRGNFVIVIKEPCKQEERESVLKTFIDASNLNIDAIPMRKDDVWGWLVANTPDKPELFKNIGSDTFEKFWKKQNICKLQRGILPRSKENPSIRNLKS